MGSGNIKPFDRADKSLFDQVHCCSIGSCKQCIGSCSSEFGEKSSQYGLFLHSRRNLLDFNLRIIRYSIRKVKNLSG